MKTLIGLLMLSSGLAHAAPLSWPDSAIKKIESAKTIKDLACGSPNTIAGHELCESFAKSYALKNTVKVLRVSESILNFKSGSGTYKVERTDSPLRFLINDRMIDLKKYPNQERLGFAIEAALNPHSAEFALMSRAYAAAQIEESVRPAVQGLLVTMGENANCKGYLTLVETCNSNLDQIFAYLKDKKLKPQTDAEKLVKEKVEAVYAKLTDADATITTQYGSTTDEFDNKEKGKQFGSAMSCDCSENKEQNKENKACTKEGRAAMWGQRPFVDPQNPTVPRQKGMLYCQRFLKEVIATSGMFAVKSKKMAETILNEIEGNVATVKQDYTDPGIKK